jgi:hypothetical protein
MDQNTNEIELNHPALCRLNEELPGPPDKSSK